MNKILGVGASPRKGGNSDALLKKALEGARNAGAKTELVFLRDYRFDSCIGCERCRKDKACTGLLDGMQLIYPLVVECRGLIVASPTHNYNVTALMKAFIDRLYQFYNFSDERPGEWSSRLGGQGRKFAAVAVCEQLDPADMGFTLDGMVRPLTALGYDCVGQLPIYGIFPKGLVKKQAEALKMAEELGVRLVEELARG